MLFRVRVCIADHLFEAAVRGSSDEIAGVSECIIMGMYTICISVFS